MHVAEAAGDDQVRVRALINLLRLDLQMGTTAPSAIEESAEVAARRLGNPVILADSTETLLCSYLSAILLVGLLLNAMVGWWWGRSARCSGDSRTGGA